LGYGKNTLWQDKNIYTVRTSNRDTQFSFTMYVVYFSHYINFIIRKSERFVGVLFISISLSKSHYHTKQYGLSPTGPVCFMPLSKSHYHIKLFAMGKNEGLAILL